MDPPADCLVKVKLYLRHRGLGSNHVTGPAGLISTSSKEFEIPRLEVSPALVRGYKFLLVVGNLTVQKASDLISVAALAAKAGVDQDRHERLRNGLRISRDSDHDR